MCTTPISMWLKPGKLSLTQVLKTEQNSKPSSVQMLQTISQRTVKLPVDMYVAYLICRKTSLSIRREVSMSQAVTQTSSSCQATSGHSKKIRRKILFVFLMLILFIGMWILLLLE